MSRILLIVVFVLSVCHSLQATENPKKLIFSFGSHNASPYTFTDGDRITSGIIWDIAYELADELNAQVDFFNIPRKRQANYLEKGIVDIILISNPKWLANKDKLIWSKALFKESDILVTLSDNPLIINSKQDLYGLKLGTIRGYKYQLIEEDLNQHLIKRDDVRELNSNFDKLLLTRIDAFIDSSILINHRLSKREDRNKFQIAPFIFSEHQIYAAISPKSSIAPKKIISTLEKLQKNGVIEAILHKYQ